MIYGDAEDLDRALPHFQRSISLKEQAGNPYSAAQTRRNVALAFLRADRRPDALEYAEAALRGFESYGERTAADIEKTRLLIAGIRGA